jgi:hypothetical protein
MKKETEASHFEVHHTQFILTCIQTDFMFAFGKYKFLVFLANTFIILSASPCTYFYLS